mmetsp:Transcript_3703/g.8535  ORF Transcript_3703/g.8535 Transcript_3703/m.8535 type:complete len:791 (+) Transcript_3703:66-2438(+)
MAERQMEAAQRARRQPDYDSDDDVSSVDIYSTSEQQQFQKATSLSPTNELESFDPYRPRQPASDEALFDATAFELSTMMDEKETKKSTFPGGAGYLEIEEEPPRPVPLEMSLDSNAPIRTSSGLLLTHRRASPTNASNNRTAPTRGNTGGNTAYDSYVQRRQAFEMENGIHGNPGGYGASGYGPSGRHAMTMAHGKQMLSYARLWVVVCFGALLITTGALMHSFGNNGIENESIQKKNDASQVSNLQQDVSQYQNNVAGGQNSYYYPVSEQVLLVPMENISQLAAQQQENLDNPPRRKLGVSHLGHHQHHDEHMSLHKLRMEFENWISEHKKVYHSHQEKEHRFAIWSQNHQRTKEKNRRHGRCKMTKKEVFGSNHLMDLSPEEFVGKFLTGYKGPRTDEIHNANLGMGFRRLGKHHTGKALDPKVQKAKIHETVKRRMLQKKEPVMRSKMQCKWYDVSCILRWLYNSSGMQFGLIGTMEPKYDADAYPNAVDWRDSGAVTDVRYQGECGACWAITAVETVESAHFIGTGDLYDLSEAEVITCETSCSMCDGGWPQNAFQWVMDHGGLPLSNNFAYDSYTLLEMTYGLSGTSNYWTEDSVSSKRSQVCPADSDGDKSQQSGDEYYDEGGQNNNYGDYSSQGRYGNIKGFGYATDRCICYSDGSGCDCDDQDEGTAVRNVASYGPAVVCLEASLWQDYSGGIITSELGCGNQFLDMNHCVQVVGYAYTDGSNNEDDNENNSNSGSQDDSAREGYWIVRNQWGNSWGMNGYAYVAMGENTCGILNDMTQAYL